MTAGSVTLGVAVGPRQFTGDQLSAEADVIRATHERVQWCQDPQTEFALLMESLGASRINHLLRVHGHAILQERAAESYDEVGSDLSRAPPEFTENSTTQATLSAGQSIGYKRARDITAPAHQGALAAKPHIQAMIQESQLVFFRSNPLAAVTETALSTYLDALDDEDKATAKLYVQKAA